MRPIGRPQFSDPTVTQAYAVLSSATGTAAELDAIRQLAREVKGESKDQIGSLIEAFIVKFGLPDNG